MTTFFQISKTWRRIQDYAKQALNKFLTKVDW